MRIAGLDGATSIKVSLGDNAVRFAILPDGSVQSWGRNLDNAAGTGTLDPVLQPTALPGVADARDVGENWGAGYAGADGFFKAGGSSYDAYVPQEVPWGPRTVAGLTGLRWVSPWLGTNNGSATSYTVLLADGTLQRLTVPFQEPTS